ncbi:MAG: YggS family pyridoxal phosphate-dependent enzyme [Nevskiales bacterium]|nr:YggS family pyridoxal phosphate-dependent enzyme [Nevskiales bacterium]
MNNNTRHYASPPCYAHEFESYARNPSGNEVGNAADLMQRLSAVRTRIAAACARCGREPGEVRLLPVSKTVSVERLRGAAAEAGLTAFGENNAQELSAKVHALTDLPLRWSLIGHLQTNKVRLAARHADEFQALDSLKLAKALDRHLQVEGRRLDVFIQVNSSGEARKFGLEPEAVPAFVRSLRSYETLRVRGLMTLVAHSADPQRVRNCFRVMRELRETLRRTMPTGSSIEELSMGMSADFEMAVEEGATVVRIGQAIFGRRPVPDNHYWPDAGPA